MASIRRPVQHHGYVVIETFGPVRDICTGVPVSVKNVAVVVAAGPRRFLQWVIVSSEANAEYLDRVHFVAPPSAHRVVQIRRIVPSVLNHYALILWADSPDRMGCSCRDRTTSGRRQADRISSKTTEQRSVTSGPSGGRLKVV
jgi:hypothetical protein